MTDLRSVCVFLGSSLGTDTAYAAAATALGGEIAERGLRLVYGGASVGLMGAVADAALAGGAEVVGVIPRALAEKEVGHGGLTELRVVATMHERKATMAELSDAFVALPGGLGTLEEIFEALTWTQLGVHAKNCALLDVDGYFDALVTFLDRAVEDGFVKPEHRAMLVVEREPGDLLDALARARPPDVPKWIDVDET